MSEHVTDRLAIEAAGALDSEEAAQVIAHLRECAPCAARAAEWRRLAESLRYLPQSRPAPALLAWTRQAVERRLAERAERVQKRTALGFLIALSWALVGVTWLTLDLLGREVTLRLGRPIGSPAVWFTAYVVAGCVIAGAAAVLLGRRAREEGRTA